MNIAIRKIIKAIYTRGFIDYGRDYRNSALLSGTGRSGTTWVSNIINYKNEYRYIFEPFHPYEVSVCRRFRYRQHLRPGNKARAFIEPAKAILSGKVRNRWTDNLNKKLLSNRRLIKDIRANHLLKWIHVNFPGIPIILQFRHPCAVANSKLKLNWNTHLEEFLDQKS